MADMTAIPEHVPADRVFDFDFVDDPLLKPDPHLGLLELRRRAPEIFYTPRYGGHWVVQGHEAITSLVQDTELFSSAATGEFAPLPISVDPPEHGQYRGALLQAFSPRTVNALRPAIQQLVADLIDNVAATGRCEFVADIAEPLPVIIFMQMLGLPVEQMPEFRRVILAFLKAGNRAEGARWMQELGALIEPVLEARMARREDDLISRLIDASLGDRNPTIEEIRRYLPFLTTAGLDTTTNAMSFMFQHLASDLPLQDRIRADTGLIPQVIEECLRRYSVSSVGRIIGRDGEYRDVCFRKGDNVHVLLPSANLDPALFPDPEQVILDRDAPPVTFGTGIHRCLGSHLARLELRNVLTEWFARIPAFRIDPEMPARMHAGFVYTVDALPLIWDAKEQVASQGIVR
jgi:cytochrome P450